MSIDKTDLRNRMGRLRQAFLKADCQSVEVLTVKYKLPLSFLTFLCELDLLVSQKQITFCRSAAWLREPNMTLTRLINIATGKTKIQTDSAPVQLPQTPPVSAEMRDMPINTPFLGNVIKSRKSLTMGFKLTNAKQLKAELSWYSSQAFDTIEANNPEARRRYYEQEALEVDGQLYRVVDLEQHMLKALKEFFDGAVVETTVKRIHYS
ncbi:hypothetical protein [Spirosoma pollinicola]|uniref:Uncharacterized protein n=1 Tax=Spirosoma pollinicola TaxID=2057025 RepID=A0A2K8ZB28_9BACT|nr:hypothetical protein [Spirosoma pollinicola]AUD07055.1 hypothetical protein CWM47_37700 [Spirosoma pollinicola]